MITFQKILVPTDFSECAEDAVRMAVEMAQKFGARITLLHVYQIPAYPMADGTFAAGPQVTQEIVKDILGALDKTRKELEGKVPVTTQISEGVPYVEIARAAREGGYDLIVIGTHGRTGLRHLLLGSVAERVVRTAPCPVLTMRAVEPQAAAGDSQPD